MKTSSEVTNQATFILCRTANRRTDHGGSYRARRANLTAAVLGLALCAPAFGANLFSNGSFELGNTGFSTDLPFVAAPPFGQIQNGVYGMASNPSSWFTFNTWSSIGDHTTGSGLMFLTTPNPGTARIWYETENLTAGTTYNFSGWATWVATGDQNIPKLSVNAAGSSLGTFDLSTLPQGSWGHFSFNYSAPSTAPVLFSLTDLATSNVGNDFAMDDLSLSVVPEPGSVRLIGVGATALMIVRRRSRLRLGIATRCAASDMLSINRHPPPARDDTEPSKLAY